MASAEKHPIPVVPTEDGATGVSIVRGLLEEEDSSGDDDDGDLYRSGTGVSGYSSLVLVLVWVVEGCVGCGIVGNIGVVRSLFSSVC